MFKCGAGGVVVPTPDQEQLCEKNLGQMKKFNIDKLRLANAAVTPLPPPPPLCVFYRLEFRAPDLIHISSCFVVLALLVLPGSLAGSRKKYLIPSMQRNTNKINKKILQYFRLISEAIKKNLNSNFP